MNTCYCCRNQKGSATDILCKTCWNQVPKDLRIRFYTIKREAIPPERESALRACVRDIYRVMRPKAEGEA